MEIKGLKINPKKYYIITNTSINKMEVQWAVRIIEVDKEGKIRTSFSVRLYEEKPVEIYRVKEEGSRSYWGDIDSVVQIRECTIPETRACNFIKGRFLRTYDTFENFYWNNLINKFLKKNG